MATTQTSALTLVTEEARGVTADATVEKNNHQSSTAGNSLKSPQLEDLDSFNLIEPPPLDWRSDSSSECSLRDMDDPGSFHTDSTDAPLEELSDCGASNLGFTPAETPSEDPTKEKKEERPKEQIRQRDLDHSHIHSLLTQLQLFHPTPPPTDITPESKQEKSACSPEFLAGQHSSTCLVPEISEISTCTEGNIASGLLFTESHQKDLLQLLEEPEPEEPHAIYTAHSNDSHAGHIPQLSDPQTGYISQTGNDAEDSYETMPSYKDVPGPCDPEDLLDGVIFGAKYLGSTQLQSDKTPSTNARMAQAQEAVDRIKAPEGESQPMTEVDLFISTQRIKVLSADTQEAMMDHPLQMISYIADIGSVVVLMARRKPPPHKPTNAEAEASAPPKKCWMICHVFSSDDAQVIAQAIGQAFGVAYQQFLQENGLKAGQLRPGEYSDYLGTQEQYNGDLVHFSRSENIREICIKKQIGEILGIAVVESGWGSILPTVVVANLLHRGPAERSGELSIGDRIMSVNGTSLVGLPITTCHNIIRDLKSQAQVKISIVHCPPVTMAIIKRPDPKYQLGFSVEDGIICSLMRGGIAERGGIRVGHRIIEINGQSVVATPHEKIIQILSNAVGEIHLKTMPTSTYRLLTGQEQPVFL
uniref:Amyloid-beta A4 precursor protein-binding family A member 3 n=1 Tax=Astyanax mexicanus TaxID=7994 RepID=A0A8B9J5D8_ASTMX